MSEFLKLAAQFPGTIALVLLALVADALVSSLSVVSIAPLADLLLERPEVQWLPVTKTLRNAAVGAGLPFNVTVLAVTLWTTILVMSLLSVLVRHQSVRLRMKVVQHLLAQSLGTLYKASWRYFAEVRRGDLINTYVNEINKTGVAFQAMLGSVASLTRIAAFVAVPVWMEPVLVLGGLGGVVLLLVPFLLLGRRSYRYGGENVATANRFTALVRESLDAVKEVVSFGRAKETLVQLNNAFRSYETARLRSETFGYLVTQLYEPVAFALLLVLMGVARLKGVAVTTVAVMLWGLLRTIPPLKQFIQLKHQLDNTLPSLEQVRRQQAHATACRRNEEGAEIIGPITEIGLHKVSFGYDACTRVLHDVDIVARKGEVVALVGESGSGKSTISDLLLGLLVPDSGTVTINGLPLERTAHRTWREKTGFVPQKPVLFDLTIRKNLLWSNPRATELDLWEACRTAGAEEFIRKLPKGLDTEIGDAGIRLSGGQAQRLALARALVRRPELLILDEATSALDSETEAAVHDSLFKRVQDAAVLIIAHRLSTVRNADRIYVMRGGKIVEEGNYKSLTENESYFKRLAQFQQVLSAQ